MTRIRRITVAALPTGETLAPQAVARTTNEPMKLTFRTITMGEGRVAKRARAFADEIAGRSGGTMQATAHDDARPLPRGSDGEAPSPPRNRSGPWPRGWASVGTRPCGPPPSARMAGMRHDHQGGPFPCARGGNEQLEDAAMAA